jgi:hypothetical protein
MDEISKREVEFTTNGWWIMLINTDSIIPIRDEWKWMEKS